MNAIKVKQAKRVLRKKIHTQKYETIQKPVFSADRKNNDIKQRVKDIFVRENNGKQLIYIDILKELFSDSSHPFIPGDLVIAEQVYSIDFESEKAPRYWLKMKSDNTSLEFFKIFEKNDDCYMLISQPEGEVVDVQKKDLFEIVEVYKAIRYERYI